jgi:hypothetical protein
MPGTDRNHRCAGWWKAFTIREKSLELGSGSGTYCGYTQPAKVVRKTLILVPFFEDHGEGLRIPPSYSPSFCSDCSRRTRGLAFLLRRLFLGDLRVGSPMPLVGRLGLI